MTSASSKIFLVASSWVRLMFKSTEHARPISSRRMTLKPSASSLSARLARPARPPKPLHFFAQLLQLRTMILSSGLSLDLRES